MVWYSHLLKNFPQFVVIHTVKGFLTCSLNGCFLTCTQICQETGQMVWHSHLLKNFPQFVVIHIVKRFGIVNKVKVDVFLVNLV